MFHKGLRHGDFHGMPWSCMKPKRPLICFKYQYFYSFHQVSHSYSFDQVSHSYSFDMNAIVIFFMQMFEYGVEGWSHSKLHLWIPPLFRLFSIMYLIINIDGDLMMVGFQKCLCFYDGMYIEFTQQVIGLWKLLLLPSHNGRLLRLID